MAGGNGNRNESRYGHQIPGSRFPRVRFAAQRRRALVRNTARQFIEDNLIPIIEECNRAGRFPRELVKPMAELGFFGASLEGYGCAGMSNVEYGLVMQEMERGDSGVRSFVSVQSALVMYPIYTFGSEEQKQTWLPAMQNGEKLGCFGLTEPDFGSNPGGMRTRAAQVGNEYVLNGEKMWITSGSIADVAVIWAKVEERRRIRSADFWSRPTAPAFRAEDIHGKWSLRASVTSGLVFAGCAYSGVEPAAQAGGLEVSTDVLESGALRNRLGRGGSSHGLLRLRPAVCPVPQAVPRPADCVAPADPGKARLDDQRDHQRPAPGSASRDD